MADAIALAYQSNPTLLSQRAQLRAQDEAYVQALAGFRPTLTATANVSHTNSPESQIFGGTSETIADTGQMTLSANQPLYTGGRVTAQVNVAEAQILAAREQLRSVEANVLLNVIQAYEDVTRDRASLTIQRDSLAALTDTTNEIVARQEAGANTNTDVAQAQAQLEAAKALVTSAQSQLEISTAEYVADIGQSPGNLAPAPTLADLPQSIDQAFDVAEAESPTLRQAKYTETANRAQVMEARAARRPTLTLSGTLGENSLSAPFDHHDYDHAVAISANFTQPIFTGGTTSSQIRQAMEQDTSARIQIDVNRRTVIQNVSQAWSQRRAAHLNTTVDNAQVHAAQAAYDGMREEYRAGLRSTLDVLTSQQTLRDSQIALAQARHDEYLAEASLLGSVGRLEARIIVQGIPLYQPQVSLRKVAHKAQLPWDIVPEALDRIGAPAPSTTNTTANDDYSSSRASGTFMTPPQLQPSSGN
ncbi:MAG: TolC family outer membrane protein [Caulobacteraceae bacterium]